MHVVVFTRSTPDTAAKVEVDGNGNVTWGDTPTVVNPWDEYALEEAIVHAKEYSGKATVIAIGGEMHQDALKHSLAMGVNEAIRIEDAGLDESDGLSYATAAAAAVNKLGDVDLVICGKESIDVGTDQHTYMIARKLGWTTLSYVSKILEIDYDARTIKVEKMLEQGKQVVTSQLPAVVSVMKGINEPRYPLAKRPVRFGTWPSLGLKHRARRLRCFRSRTRRSVTFRSKCSKANPTSRRLHWWRSCWRRRCYERVCLDRDF